MIGKEAAPSRKPWVIGVSGASGTPYAAAVLRSLLDAGEAVDLVISREARLTLLDEAGIAFRPAYWRDDVSSWIEHDVVGVQYWSASDFTAGPSSGSYQTKGMVIVPATTAAVAGITVGMSKDLLQRAADVTLKERRPLVLVVRETPLRRSTLLQLAALAEEGAVILPASPGFYAGSSSVQQLVDFVAGKVLDILGVDHDLYQRWPAQRGPRRDPEERSPEVTGNGHRQRRPGTDAAGTSGRRPG